MSADWAVRFDAVDKSYRLYGSRRQAVLDRLGYYRMRFWRRAPQWRDFQALRGVSLDIRRGERVGIVGRNGAGKTTLLKLVSGNFRPTRGSVSVHGQVQALMQTGVGFFPEFTGLENVRSALLYNGLDGAQLERAVEDVIEFAELGEFIHRPVKTYSLGMATRLEFAAATAVQPEILIVDEVLGAGDGYFSHKSAERMHRLTRSGCTLLLVSHSAQQVMEFCERAVWLDRGAVRASGPVREVLAAFANDIAAARESAAATDGTPLGESLELARRPFLRDAILLHEPVDAARETEIEVTLADGRHAFRWAGRAGLRFASLRCVTEGGHAAETGKKLAFELDCAIEATGSYAVVYRAMIYDMAGVPVCTVTSTRDIFSARAGERRRVRFALEPLLLGVRDYLFSFAILDAALLEQGDSARGRFDLLSRSFHLRMQQTNDTDPPVLLYPATWRFGEDSPPRPSLVSGWV